MDLFSQLLLVARFLCFMAVFYLALHTLIARLSRKPDGKVLWFFAVLTAPLTRPLRALTINDASNHQLLTKSLLFYVCVWLGLIALSRILK
jgi:hypothetical protein